MSLIVCQGGKEPTIREAIDYLERKYGIPAGDIRAVSVNGEVGNPILITVTVYQQDEVGFTAEPAVWCAGCHHQAHLHWDEDRSNPTPRCVGPGPGLACDCDRSCQLVNQLAGKDLDAGVPAEHDGSGVVCQRCSSAGFEVIHP